MKPRRYRCWYTEDELQFISDHLRLWAIEHIARHLHRTPAGIRRACWNRRYRPTTQDWLSSSDARAISGYSQQHLNLLARNRKVQARRIPGGRWWLFNPDALPKKGQARVLQL